MYKISDKKQRLLDKFNRSRIKVGEMISVNDEYLKNNKYNGVHRNEYYKVLSVSKEGITINTNSEYPNRKPHLVLIKKSDVGSRKEILNIGEDPFERKFQSVRPVAFTLDSIVFTMELMEKRREDNYEIGGYRVMEVNWNPYVYNNKGEKVRYQRDFCWTIQQEQLLIESIYKGISCGNIIVRKRSWRQLEAMANRGESELSFTDIVDGKQRLNAIRRFLNNEFPDLHGNYFGDLNTHAQYDFGNHQLFQYAEMREDCTDEEVLYQFLLMNHEGTPQSPEHLDFVKNLLTIVRK